MKTVTAGQARQSSAQKTGPSSIDRIAMVQSVEAGLPASTENMSGMRHGRQLQSKGFDVTVTS
jgi:hypothetical protein